MAKFLDETGLAKLVSLIKGYAVPLTGGTITGDLTVEGKTTVQAPTEDTDAATKAYVDEAVANAESGTLDEAVTDVTYSSGTLTVEKGDGSSTTASINPVTSVSASSGVLTAAKADGTNAFSGNVLETMSIAILTDPFDFNDLTTSGYYRIAASASGIIQEQTNGPTSSPQVGVVWVYPRAGGSLSQIFIPAAMTDIYMRRYASSAWGDWHQYASLDSSSAGVITTYYTSGTTGYALFSNNYIIQWGQSGSLSNGGSETITLPHAMANTSYYVSGFRRGEINSNMGESIINVGANRVSTTQINVSMAWNKEPNNLMVEWLVIGQAAT